MALFAISDLHLSFGTDKPMDIFKGWDNHTERLTANWKRLIKPEDTVVLPGDFSWALKVQDSLPDFKKMIGAGVGRIVTAHGFEMYMEWMKELEETEKPPQTDGDEKKTELKFV